MFVDPVILHSFVIIICFNNTRVRFVPYQSWPFDGRQNHYYTKSCRLAAIFWLRNQIGYLNYCIETEAITMRMQDHTIQLRSQ